MRPASGNSNFDFDICVWVPLSIFFSFEPVTPSVWCIVDCLLPEDKELAYLSCFAGIMHISVLNKSFLLLLLMMINSVLLQHSSKYINYFHIHPGRKESIVIDI